MLDLIRYRGLVWELAMRDVKLRYRNLFLGFLWMLIIPFSTALVYKVLFSDFFRMSSGKVPFFIHLITAILPWTYFASSVQASSRCMLDSKNLINQISFPRYLLPVATVCANLINFLPTLVVLLGFLVVFKISISNLIIFLPVVILVQTILIIGLSLLFSGLQVIYRDIEYIIQIFLMVLFFLTPGVYTLEELISKTSPGFVKLYMLNPLAGITNLYRVIFIKGYADYFTAQIGLFNTLINPILWGLVFLFFGYSVFKKCEKKFADYINL
ncbi:MAG: ABC transporter permease [Candidatus Omnitrophica bacterium]|nr:ABC transporter permease [Candidatus Omnitrophota bacterium]